MSNDSQCPTLALPRIGVDVMGSDYGPEQLIKGASLALASVGHRIGSLTLVGDEAIIQPLMQRNGLDHAKNITLCHTPEVLKMDDHPLDGLRHKKEASVFKTIDLVTQGEADAVISCGNTGGLMAGSTLKLKTIEGVIRPALASIIPTSTDPFILVDVGANPANDAHYLVHNAILGAHFAKAVLHCEKPRVGLLTIGKEEGKGTTSIQAAHAVLKQCTDRIHYIGLVEGFDLFSNGVDVVVCDGFVGNILLKSCESLFGCLSGFLKQEFKRYPIRKLGALLCNGVFKEMKRNFAPEQFSGAPLLGLNGWVFKAHGSSKAEAIAGCIQVCLKCIEVFNVQTVKSDVAYANAVLLASEGVRS